MFVNSLHSNVSLPKFPPDIKNLHFDWFNMFLCCYFRKEKCYARKMPGCPEKKHESDLKIFASIFRKL